MGAHLGQYAAAASPPAPAVAVLAVDTRFHEHIPALFLFRPELKDVFEASEQMRTNTGTFNATEPFPVSGSCAP